MRSLFLSLLAVVGLGYVTAPASLQEKGGDDRTGPYDAAPNWPLPLAFARPGTAGDRPAGFSPNRPTASSSPTAAS